MLSKSFLSNAFDLAREMDRLFESMASGTTAPAAWSRIAYPPMNIWEDDSALYVEAELPGHSLDQIEVSVAGDLLTLKGVRQVTVPENATALRRERGIGQFERAVSLPCPVQADRVEASLRQGVLTITLPKTAELQPRRIAVKTG
jgi:HSP20 family protein